MKQLVVGILKMYFIKPLEMVHYLQKNLSRKFYTKPLIKLGFGLVVIGMVIHLVTTEITLKVADRLRTSILKCYYIEIRNLKKANLLR
jgi:phosphoenolpyruvate carboxylase